MYLIVIITMPVDYKMTRIRLCLDSGSNGSELRAPQTKYKGRNGYVIA